MNVCVLGLWHLGTVTAACLAAAGHRVTGVDFDATVVDRLRAGKAPLFEPGLDDLIAANPSLKPPYYIWENMRLNIPPIGWKAPTPGPS